VSSPEVHVFLPSATKATGTAVVIFPGGGYGIIAFEHEGIKIAEALNAQGIAAIVVKYRLPSDAIMKDKSIGPLQDAQEAIRLVRRNAAAWKINPDKVGVMGFSAGGHLAASVSTRFNEVVYKTTDATSARPNFSLLIYPVISFQEDITHMGSRENLIGKNPNKAKTDLNSSELQITSDTPPAFLIHSADDNAVVPENSIRYFNNLFQHGGHGFGLGNADSTEGSWITLCLQWLKTHNW
jgi:acetyl esterase/lipase